MFELLCVLCNCPESVHADNGGACRRCISCDRFRNPKDFTHTPYSKATKIQVVMNIETRNIGELFAWLESLDRPSPYRIPDGNVIEKFILQKH